MVINMKKEMNISGMMCPHCEASVKKALENLPEVDLAEVNHKEGKAILTLNAAVSDAVLKTTIEELGFKVF